MKRISRVRAHRGLTLVEMMIALVLLATLLNLSVPAFSRLQGNLLLRSSAHRLVAAINLARAEALGRKLPVSLCPSTGGLSCAGDYSDGWLLFQDTDRDQRLDPGSEEVLFLGQGMPDGYTVTDRSGRHAAAESINYYPDGTVRRNRTLLLCAPWEKGVAPYSIVLNFVGRVRVAQGEGHCPGATE